MREYYIRREGDEDSSGPFDIDQISSLMEAGKLDASAYYYDIESETWKSISSNEEMMDALFPKKRKLSLRTPEAEAQRRREEQEAKARQAEAAARAAAAAQGAETATATGEDATAAADASAGPVGSQEEGAESTKSRKGKKGARLQTQEPEKIEVTRMLAVAEGRAHDPSGKSPRERKAAAAYFGLRQLTVFFIASVLAMAYLEWDLVSTANALQMAESPYLILAAFDLIATVVLLLQVTEIYPLLRFRAAIGAGLLTILFWASGDPVLIVSNLALMVAIYMASAIVTIRYLFVSAGLGALAVLGYAFVFFR